MYAAVHASESLRAHRKHPHDRAHYIAAPSVAFPFGLVLGSVGKGDQGTEMSNGTLPESPQGSPLADFEGSRVLVHAYE